MRTVHASFLVLIFPKVEYVATVWGVNL